MTQAQKIAGDHVLAQLQTFGDRITIVLEGTEIDRRLQRKQGGGRNHAPVNSPFDPGQISLTRLRFKLLESSKTEHKTLAGGLRHGSEGNGWLLAGVQLNPGPQPLTVAKLAIWIRICCVVCLVSTCISYSDGKKVLFEW